MAWLGRRLAGPPQRFADPLWLAWISCAATCQMLSASALLLTGSLGLRRELPLALRAGREGLCPAPAGISGLSWLPSWASATSGLQLHVIVVLRSFGCRLALRCTSGTSSSVFMALRNFCAAWEHISVRVDGDVAGIAL